MTRVALSMDEAVLERAKRYAVARKTSVSKLFVSMVVMLDQEDDRQAQIPPVTRQLGGLLRPDDGGEVDCGRILDEYRMERFGAL